MRTRLWQGSSSFERTEKEKRIGKKSYRLQCGTAVSPAPWDSPISPLCSATGQELYLDQGLRVNVALASECTAAKSLAT